MIVRITKHKTDPDLVLAHTPPDLAHDVMGPYGPARWSKQLKAYLLREVLVDQFRAHLARHDVLLVDERGKDDEPEKFTGPLPECSACGQPASRPQALALNRCPGCGAHWKPVVHEQTGPTAFRVECGVCGRRQRAGHAYCGGCGAPAATVPAGAPRPAEARTPLEEPLPLGEAIAEVEDELDYAKRAAGDR